MVRPFYVPSLPWCTTRARRTTVQFAAGHFVMLVCDTCLAY